MHPNRPSAGDASRLPQRELSAERMISVCSRRTIGGMDAVALAATIGGSAVALAGVGATAWGVKQQRESAKELEASRQKHERRLASGDRLFGKRAAVYLEMIGLVRVWFEEVANTLAILEVDGAPPLPEPPSPDTQRAFDARLRTFGTTEIADKYDEFLISVVGFHLFAGSVRQQQENPDLAADVPWDILEVIRSELRDDLATIEKLVSEELASL